MKKIVLISLFLTLFFLVGCGNSKNDGKGDSRPDDDSGNTDTPDIETSDEDPDGPLTGEDADNTKTSDTETSDDDSGDDSNTMPDDDTDTAAEPTEEEKCVAGNGFWNSSECFHPCENNPCGGIENSTEKCTPTGVETYSCGCSEGFAWVNASKACLPAVLGRFCTGQTKCFNEKNQEIECPAQGEDFYGQDAQYAAKGLCIQKNLDVKTLEGKNVIEDLNTKLMWQQEIPEGLYLWEKAAEYCESLNYAGFKDWRLPRPEELLSIADSGRSKPALDTDFFPNMIYVDPEPDVSYYNNFFWSSKNLHPGSADRVPCLLDISDGLVSCSYSYSLSGTPYSSRIVCVRGNEFANKAQLSTTENGEVVIDSLTGLMWQGIPDADTRLNWKELLSHCENLDYAGYTDWRVPNKNELASLLNFDKTASPFSDFPGIIDEACSSTPLEDTDSQTALGLAWFDNGDFRNSYALQCNTVCVRN